MPYTMEDFKRECAEDLLNALTPEQRLQGLSPEQLLSLLPLEQIEAFVKKKNAAQASGAVNQPDASHTS